VAREVVVLAATQRIALDWAVGRGVVPFWPRSLSDLHGRERQHLIVHPSLQGHPRADDLSEYVGARLEALRQGVRIERTYAWEQLARRKRLVSE
jgi:hypothetical protein